MHARGLRLCVALALAGACVRVAPAPRTFDGLLRAVARTPATGRADVVRRFIVAAGPVPIVDGTRITFIVEARTHEAPPRIVGDFNGWAARADSYDPAAGTMIPLPGTPFFYLQADVRPAARLEYLIARGTRFETDPRNPRRVRSATGDHSEVVAAGYVAPPELSDVAGAPEGRLVAYDVPSRALNGSRRVQVYLPAGYGWDTRRYPAAYFADGGAYVDRLGAPRLLDRILARGDRQPLVAVFVDTPARGDEYRMNPAWRRFMADELAPFIDRSVRTRPEPSSRAIVGSSLGALAAADLARARPDRFGYCAALSPGYEPAPLLDAIGRSRAAGGRWFVLVGTYDGLRPQGLALRDALASRGADVQLVEVPEGHSIHTWRGHLREALAAFAPAPLPTPR